MAAKSRFRVGDHVIKKNKHADVIEIVDNMGTEMPKIKYRPGVGGGKETVFDKEISGTRQCSGRNGCPQGDKA